MGDVVPVRVAAERLKMDRRNLSRLLHRGDLPTACWRDQGRWVDVDAVAAVLDARHNGGGGHRRVDTYTRPPVGQPRGTVPYADGDDIDPGFRAMAAAVAHDVVTAALADFRALAQRLADVEDERRELDAERRRLREESERLREAAPRHALARRAYDQRRAELSAALADVGRGSAGKP